MNTSNPRVTFFHSPNTRSTGVLTLSALTGQLAQRPYLLGERFSAADVLWGTALAWTTMFKLVPELPVIRAAIDRVAAGPAVARAQQKDAEIAARQAS